MVQLKTLGIPRIGGVFYAEGLKANLISISKICNDKYNVQFIKGTCSVLNGDTFLLVDDFSIYGWVRFIKEKYDPFDVFTFLCQNKKVVIDKSIRFQKRS